MPAALKERGGEGGKVTLSILLKQKSVLNCEMCPNFMSWNIAYQGCFGGPFRVSTNSKIETDSADSKACWMAVSISDPSALCSSGMGTAITTPEPIPRPRLVSIKHRKIKIWNSNISTLTYQFSCSCWWPHTKWCLEIVMTTHTLRRKDRQYYCTLQPLERVKKAGNSVVLPKVATATPSVS